MSFVRPALVASFAPWGEVISAGALAIAGLWVTAMGGWFLVPLGLLISVLATGWAVVAHRRLRFRRAVTAPGVVEIDEGQIGYFGPSFGGFIALDDLVELRLTELHEIRQWRLKTRASEVLLIPTTASGADRLFDAFATLPGIEMGVIAAALDRGTATLPLWRRPDTSPVWPRLDHELS